MQWLPHGHGRVSLTFTQWIVPGLRGMFIDPIILSILVRKTFICKQVLPHTALPSLAILLTRDTAGHERGRGPTLGLGRLQENARKYVRCSSFIFEEFAPDPRSLVTLFFSALLSPSRRSVGRLQASPPSLCPHATPTPAETRSPPWLPLRAPLPHRGRRG
jgi:hypothetical protein